MTRQESVRGLMLVPKAELIRSRIARHWTPQGAVAELVDNSLAENKGGAKDVYVELGRDYIEVTDHGKGCDDINRLFCLGDSSSFQDRDDIGLYGVGATDAAMWLGVQQIVVTVRDGRRFEKRHKWIPSRPRWPKRTSAGGLKVDDTHPLADGGTQVRIEGIRKGRRMQVDSLVRELGRLFSPGILAEKRIYVRRGTGTEWQEVPPLEGPPLDQEHTIRWRGDVEGLKYFAEVGWMSEPRPDFNCVQVSFGHRVIERTTDFFLDKRSGLITGTVYLEGGWKYHLEDHKGRLVGGHLRDELMKQIYEKALPLIEEAQGQERSLKLGSIAARLTQSLVNVGIRGGKGWKPVDSREQTPAPDQESGRPRRRNRRPVAPEDGGEYGRDRRHSTGISIGWFQDPSLERLVQTKYEAGKIRVLFNSDHPEIEKATADPSNDFGLVSTALARVSDLLSGVTQQERQRLLPSFQTGDGVQGCELADRIYAHLMRGLEFSTRGRLAS